MKTLKIITILVVSNMVFFGGSYAADTPKDAGMFDSLVDSITKTPESSVRTLPDGSTARINTIPEYPNYAAGTVTTKDGKVLHVATNLDANGNQNFNISDGQNTYSATCDSKGACSSSDPRYQSIAQGLSKSGDITVFTTEPVPGADCKCISGQTGPDGKSCIGPVETRKYECTTKPGLTGFQEIFAKIIRYVINITLLLGVLAIVGLGIAWSLAGGEDVKMKSTLKTWAINIVIGLIILFLFRYILMFLAPWVYQ